MMITDRRLREALDQHLTDPGIYRNREDPYIMDAAIVMTSGGQDSTTCLGWTIEQWGADRIKTIAFDYGQRHRVELDCARDVCSQLGVEQPIVLSIGALSQLGAAALTSPSIDVDVDAAGTGNVFAEAHDLPSTFVPGRNALFFTLAAAYGARFGIHDLVTGICATDRAGYPDCRREFVPAMEEALTIALDDEAVTIHAPLLDRTKAETWQLARELGILPTIIEKTNTCYHGDRDHRHDWGYGCGECGACDERHRGYEEFLAVA